MSGWDFPKSSREGSYPESLGTSLNPLLEQINKNGQSITSLDDSWEQGLDYGE
ncbi:hypothetical protein [Ammoniphilus sp. CFH 90114]|uniref:hypothetical protein n=1 Tax=Ammoniphilus sp. CFH 90114 TaxID=2493665 RepID=UPI0013E9507A|nr:hypothetical protein [Ammoniphilus sp. CFH 90114]